MTAATAQPGTDPAPTPVEPPTGGDKAANAAVARHLVRSAAARWLTPGTTAVLGQQVAESVDRHLERYRRGPTWAEALTGVDPALLQPMSAVPQGWPLRPALWRLQLREQLMGELKRTRWVTYTRTPRSLRPGDHGRGHLPRTAGGRTPGTAPTS